MAKRMFYKFSVWDDDGNRFYADVTTETRARQLICHMWQIAPSRAKGMWVKDNESGLLVGKVYRYSQYGKSVYSYETTDSKIRKINEDGTFVKPKKKTPAPFGL